MATTDALPRRGWATLSGALAGLTLLVYVAVIGGEGDDSFWEVFPWVLVMLVGVGAAATAALARDSRVRQAFALAAVVLLAVLGLVSILSIGLGFLLAAGAAGFAAVGEARANRPPTPEP